MGILELFLDVITEELHCKKGGGEVLFVNTVGAYCTLLARASSISNSYGFRTHFVIA